jgi:selenide,water dikinase
MGHLEAAPRLTSLSHGAGCACKIPRDRLGAIVDALPAGGDPDLLVGSLTADDAAVYRIGPGQALVHTADFFTPIVDDPRDFGRIAAANALSDVYAMGGTPLVALNLVAFPLDDLDGAILGEILAGGAESVTAAGAVVGGGHSIDDPEPKYGLAVSGIVDPDAMLTNSGAVPGDVLVLTKPLGSGLATTAAKRDLAEPDVIAAAVAVMCRLNDGAARQAREAGASAATDVTGFGLLGHLQEVCLASGVAAAIDAAAAPAIEGVLDLAAGGDTVAGGSRRNREQAEAFTTWSASVPEERRVLLTDAMTSGGLLVAVPAAGADRIDGAVIGMIEDGPPGRIAVA